MLIPMEACMGYPIAVFPGLEYLLPFFRVSSAGSLETLSPPFAYIRLRYPDQTILTYNDLRTLPDWKGTDWDAETKWDVSGDTAWLQTYYSLICGGDGEDIARMDQFLLERLWRRDTDRPGYNSSPIAAWYEKLTIEAEKYRQESRREQDPDRKNQNQKQDPESEAPNEKD